MTELDISGLVPRLHSRLGRYFDARATSWTLREELLYAVINKGDTVMLDDLPRLKWLYERGIDPVLSGANRCAEIAVTVMTLLWSEASGEWRVLLSTRSAATGTEGLLYHLAPSGKFAPLNSQREELASDYHIRKTVLREFAEECLGYADLSMDFGGLSSQLDQIPEIQRLEDQLESQEASLTYLGLYVNVLNLLPEICVLLKVDDGDWILNIMRTSVVWSTTNTWRWLTISTSRPRMLRC